MLILAADPGLSGAICLLNAAAGKLLELDNLPTRSNGSAGAIERELDGVQLTQMVAHWSMTYEFGRHFVMGVIERLQPFGQGRANTMMSMGFTEGVTLTVLERYCASVERVSPQRWKRSFGLVSKDEAKVSKTASVQMARRLYPDIGSVLRHDKAEAVLIAHWAMQTFYQKAAA